MLQCSEVKTLSIITAIFQAIAQALTYILPVSESGHSAIFHDFASRYSGSCSELTGLVHIGIAIGMIAAFYKVFIRLIYEFYSGWKDVFTKNFSLKGVSTSRKFMYLTFIPYAFMLFYLIPLDKKGNVFQILHATSYDGNLLSEGICFILSAVFLILATIKLGKNEKGVPVSLPAAALAGVVTFIALPIAGLSLSALIICILILCGINKKAAVRYFVSISVPILFVTGIIEIAQCVTYVNIISGILGVVISAAAAYFISKLLLWTVSNSKLKYFAYYNFTIGAAAVIAGVIELIIK